jgi:HEAT repeat protein
MVDEAHAWRASLWAARRLGSAGAVAVESAATNAVTDTQRVPLAVRREAAEVLAAAGSPSAIATLTKVVSESDREIRAVASQAVAQRQPSAAATAVRAIGARADATTIAPLALAAWPELAKDMIGEPSTRWWALAVSLTGKRIAELLAIATARGEDPARLAAIAALGRAGGEQAKGTLERLHKDEAEPDAVKLAAWKALKRLLRAEAKTYAEGQDKGKRGSGGGGGRGGDDDGDGGEGKVDEDEGGDDDGDGGDDEGGGDEVGDDDDDDDDDGANDWSDVMDDDDEEDDDE